MRLPASKRWPTCFSLVSRGEFGIQPIKIASPEFCAPEQFFQSRRLTMPNAGVLCLGAPITHMCAPLGGESLFDFRNFDLKPYSEMYPLSTWREFVPYRPAWKETIWI